MTKKKKPIGIAAIETIEEPQVLADTQPASTQPVDQYALLRGDHPKPENVKAFDMPGKGRKLCPSCGWFIAGGNTKTCTVCQSPMPVKEKKAKKKSKATLHQPELPGMEPKRRGRPAGRPAATPTTVNTIAGVQVVDLISSAKYLGVENAIAILKHVL